MAQNVDSLYKIDCNKINGECVDAYIDLSLDPSDPSVLILDHTWGHTELDLTPAVKDAETLTYLSIDNDPNGIPTYLRYDDEHGEATCIDGKDLSRIIYMQSLKDVDQSENPPADGIVYWYDGDKNLFVQFDLKAWKNQVDTKIANLEQQVADLIAITNEHTRKLTPPSDAPDNVSVAFGTINLYSSCDYTGSGNPTMADKQHGLYTHKLSETWIDDEIFS